LNVRISVANKISTLLLNFAIEVEVVFEMNFENLKVNGQL
jgi:hypothetical protein